MGKIKIQKKDVWIDMTPMSDVMTLLLCFFMLTSTFLQAEPVKVNTPSTVTQSKVAEDNILSILIDNEGRIFMGTENKNIMKSMFLSVCGKFNINPNGAQTKAFGEDPMVGTPLSQMTNYLNLETSKRAEVIQKMGIPTDSIDGGMSEFQEWVKAARDAESETGVDLKLAIKSDEKTPYKVIKTLMNELQDMNENRYQLVTNLKKEED